MSSPVAVTGKATDSTGAGIPAVILIQLSWDCWLTDNTAEVVQSTRILVQAAADGTWTTNLWRNIDLSPVGSSYTVKQGINGNWDAPISIVVTGAGTVASFITASPALPAQFVTGPAGATGPPGSGMQVQVNGGAALPQEVHANFIPGSGSITIGAADNPGSTRTDITIGLGTVAESQITNLTTDLAATAKTANNLSDLANATTARANLGLGTAATHATTDYDTSGLAATETTRATAAEALLAPKASPALTGTPTAPTAAPLTNTTQLASTAYADAATAVEVSRATTAEGLLAPKASPALTGVPTAPTAAALTNSTQLASTAYADAATGVEKTRAQAAEALLAPLASPALTGNPTAPTQTALNNSTRLASTAYADSAVGVETTRATAAEALKAIDTAVVHNTGTENVGGAKTFTTSVTGPIFDKGGEVFNAMATCVGDGVADDTTALNALLGSNRILVLPAGKTFLVTQLLLTSLSRVTLTGGGTILGSDRTQSIILATAPTDITIEHIRVQHQTPGIRNATAGIYLRNPTNYRIHGCEVFNTAGAGILVVGGLYGRVYGNYVYTTGADGIHHNNHDASFSGASQHVSVFGNVCFNTGDDSISAIGYQTGAAANFDFAITGNAISQSHSDGINTQGTTGCTVSGNQIDTTKASGIFLGMSGSFNTYGSQDTVIANNVITGANTFNFTAGATTTFTATTAQDAANPTWVANQWVGLVVTAGASTGTISANNTTGQVTVGSWTGGTPSANTVFLIGTTVANQGTPGQAGILVIGSDPGTGRQVDRITIIGNEIATCSTHGIWVTASVNTSSATTTFDATHAQDTTNPSWITSEWVGSTVTAGGSTATVTANNTTGQVTVASWTGGTPASNTVFTLTGAGINRVFVRQNQIVGPSTQPGTGRGGSGILINALNNSGGVVFAEVSNNTIDHASDGGVLTDIWPTTVIVTGNTINLPNQQNNATAIYGVRNRAVSGASNANLVIPDGGKTALTATVTTDNPIAAHPSFSGTTVTNFTGSGSLVIPSDVYEVSILAIGGGGGGGGGGAATGATLQVGGGGGGAGGLLETMVSVTPGHTLTVTVGTGGNGGVGGTAPGGAGTVTPSTAGGNSTVADGGTTLVLAAGGAPGLGSAGNSTVSVNGGYPARPNGGAIANQLPGVGGPSGGLSGGPLNGVVGGGGGGAATATLGGGGGGSVNGRITQISAAGAGGASGTAAGINGVTGIANTGGGGGGGGGGAAGTGAGGTGGAGATGYVEIRYVLR